MWAFGVEEGFAGVGWRGGDDVLCFPNWAYSSHLWASRNTRILQKPLGKVWHRRIESKLVYNIKKKLQIQ